MNYLTPEEYGNCLTPPIKPRRVRVLCTEGRLQGAMQFSGRWMIPHDAPDPRLPAGRPRPRQDNGQSGTTLPKHDNDLR